jgi:hypothetical protein
MEVPMLKIHNTVLAAITFLTLSTTASANDKGREPCANSGTENLQVMNTDHLRTLEGLARTPSIFTIKQEEGLCRVIDNLESAKDTEAQIRYLARAHNLSLETFFKTYVDELTCRRKNVAFHALDNEREDFMSIVELGLELNRPLKNLDGTYMTPLDYVFKKFNEADEEWLKGKLKVIIFKLKKKGAKRCSELKIDCVLSA